MRRVKKAKPTQRRTRRATKRPRKTVLSLFSRRRLLWSGSAALVILMLSGATWVVTSGWLSRQVETLVDQAYQATADAGFAIDDVLVEGRNRTEKVALLDTLGVERGTPILAVDLADARGRLEAMPWVGEAEIERRLPSWLYVRITERQPMALWQLEGEIFVIDQAGDVVAGVPATGFEHLTLVVGPGAPEHAGDLLALLNSEPDLRSRVIGAVRVSDRRWNLRMQGDVDVRLPETGAAEAWSHFAEMERQHDLLARDVKTIDLRQPDRMVVRNRSWGRVSQGPAHLRKQHMSNASTQEARVSTK